jgi:hypothetical protein
VNPFFFSAAASPFFTIQHLKDPPFATAWVPGSSFVLFRSH